MRRRLVYVLFGLLLWCTTIGCEKAVTYDMATGETALQIAAQLLKAHPSRIAGPESCAAAQWIVSQLPPGAQPLPFTSPRGTLTNIFYVPKDTTPQALLVAHFDTKSGIPGFVGANDGAAATALLIALARESNLPVAYLFVDGEECYSSYSREDGLHGSWEAARKQCCKGLPVFVLDMIGDKDWDPIVAANSSAKLTRHLFNAARELDLPITMGGDIVDDHIPFLAHGYQAINLIDFNFGPQNSWWHTTEDTLDKLSATSLAKTASLIRLTLTMLNP